MRYTTLLLDYDDTLANTEEVALRTACGTMNLILEERGFPFRYDEVPYRRRFTGTNFREALKEVHRDTGLTLTEEEVDEAVERQKIRAIAALRKTVTPAPGANEFLDYLSAHKLEFAIVSSSARERIEACLQKTDQKKYFSAERIFSAQDFKPPISKPNPAVYLEALSKLNRQPDECLAIEDSVPGVSSAARANLPVFGYLGLVPHDELESRGKELLAAGASRLFSSFSELQLHLESRN